MKIATFLSLWLSGCSWIFVDGPPANHRELSNFDCTKSRVAPIVDTVFAVTNGLSALAVLGADERDYPNKNGAALLGFGVMALWIASASSGYGNTSDCRLAMNELDVRLENRSRQPAIAAPPQVTVSGCAKDADCKGDRVCVSGVCQAPETP
jgi:hypothetical protein